jgi:homoserine O-acetyltransferase
VAPDGRPWGSHWPRITIRDQVATEAALADHLGIERWAGVFGGSMGGMRALEWTIGLPTRTGSALVLAVGAAATADEIGLYAAQLLAIRQDPNWRGGDYYDAAPGEGPHLGMELARRIAHLSYRTDTEMQDRFGRRAQGDEDPLRGGRFAVESYLDHQADKLARRFDAGTYVTLTEAMNTHDVGRGRGGVEAALRSVTVPVVVAGLDTDRLYPWWLQQQLGELIPTSDGARLLHSPFGHDGFLLEIDTVGALLAETLDRSLVGSR